MSDQINLAIGAAPWKPSADASIEQEYDRYDMPTAGILSQSGCLYLFECIDGAAQQFNFWAYAPIGSQDRINLSRLTGQALMDAMNEIWLSRDVTIALAANDHILTGAVLNRYRIKEVGLVSATLRAITALIKEEVAMTEAMKNAAR